MSKESNMAMMIGRDIKEQDKGVGKSKVQLLGDLFPDMSHENIFPALYDAAVVCSGKNSQFLYTIDGIPNSNDPEEIKRAADKVAANVKSTRETYATGSYTVAKAGQSPALVCDPTSAKDLTARDAFENRELQKLFPSKIAREISRRFAEITFNRNIFKLSSPSNLFDSLKASSRLADFFHRPEV